MPAIVRNLDDDAATIIMVDSNLQRENILPSERAQAYKMKLDAIKRQGARKDLSCGHIGTVDKVSRFHNDSGTKAKSGKKASARGIIPSTLPAVSSLSRTPKGSSGRQRP